MCVNLTKCVFFRCALYSLFILNDEISLDVHSRSGVGLCPDACISESACDSVSYLNLVKLPHSDFLYMLDKEVPNIGAITDLTSLIMMEIKEPSAAYGQVCGPMEGLKLAPVLLSC